MKSPVNGFDVARIMDSAATLPQYCKDEIIKSRAKRKMSRAARIEAVLRRKIFQGALLTVESCRGCASLIVYVNIRRALHVGLI